MRAATRNTETSVLQVKRAELVFAHTVKLQSLDSCRERNRETQGNAVAGLNAQGTVQSIYLITSRQWPIIGKELLSRESKSCTHLSCLQIEVVQSLKSTNPRVVFLVQLLACR